MTDKRHATDDEIRATFRLALRDALRATPTSKLLALIFDDDTSRDYVRDMIARLGNDFVVNADVCDEEICDEIDRRIPIPPPLTGLPGPGEHG